MSESILLPKIGIRSRIGFVCNGRVGKMFRYQDGFVTIFYKTILIWIEYRVLFYLISSPLTAGLVNKGQIITSVNI